MGEIVGIWLCYTWWIGSTWVIGIQEITESNNWITEGFKLVAGIPSTTQIVFEISAIQYYIGVDSESIEGWVSIAIHNW